MFVIFNEGFQLRIELRDTLLWLCKTIPVDFNSILNTILSHLTYHLKQDVLPLNFTNVFV